MKIFGYVHLAPAGRSTYGIFSKKSILLDAEPHIMMVARKLFGDHAKNQYNGGKLTHKPLGFALNNANAKDLIWFSERYDLEFDEGLKDELLRMEAEYDAVLAAIENSADDAVFTVSPESQIMKIQPREHQIKFRNMVRKVKKVLLADVMGMGKAQPIDEPVLTPKGFVPIGSLQPGDEVIGSSGHPVKVTGVFPQGKKEIFRIEMADRSFTYACEEHLWAYQTPSMRYHKSSQFKIEDTKGIGQFLKNKKNSNLRHFLPIVMPIQFEEKPLPIDPYLLGCLLGDGGIAHTVMFTSADQEILDKVKARLPDSISMNYASQYDWRLARKNPNKKNELISQLKELDLFGKKSDLKFVPEMYLLGSESQRLEILQGLMDTDGYADKSGYVQFASSSKRLAQDVGYLARSLGCVCRFKVKKIKGYLDCHLVQINAPAELNLFSLTRKNDRKASKRKYLPAHAVKSVAPAGLAECVCISVDSPDHLYVTRDFILTHNTISAIACMTEPDQRPVLVVCPPHLCIQWERELKRVLPNLTSHVIKGFKNYPLPGVDVLITSYNRLTYWQDILVPLPIQTLVLDEVHELRSTATAKRDTSVALSKKVPNVIGLSGTPIFNYGIEIWSVLDAIKPGALGDVWDFSGEWCVGDSVREPAVLNSYLKSQGLMLRRTPEEVGLNFGKASKHFYTLDTDLKSLEAMQNTMRALALSVLSAPLNESDAYEKDFDWKLRKATGVAKAKAVAAFVAMMASQGEKVVLAGWHRDVYDIWLKELAAMKPVMFTGTESAKEKNDAVKTFTEDDACMVFIISLGSGAGLDGLQHVCRNLVFGELDWSPHRMDQVMMRVDRDGQTKHPQGFYLAIADGSDPFIMNILQAKRSQSDGLVDGLQSEATVLEGKNKEEEKLRIREMAKAYLKSIGEELPEVVEETGLLKDVADALRSIKVPTNSEEEMQEALWKVFPGMLPHAVVEREVRVGKKSRLDFMVTYNGVKVAVELKATAQDRAAVYRQVRRYVKEAGVNAVVLFAPWFGIGSFVVDTTPVVVVDCTKAAI